MTKPLIAPTAEVEHLIIDSPIEIPGVLDDTDNAACQAVETQRPDMSIIYNSLNYPDEVAPLV